MWHVQRNCVAEWAYRSGKRYANPFWDIELSVRVTTPSGRELCVPAFHGGDNVWRVRVSSAEVGLHRCRSLCTDESNADLHGVEHELVVTEYEGGNRLLQHGPIRVAPNRIHLEYADGTPFFWLADTWWLGLVKRLRWPEDFQTLAADRAAKGFSVVQIVAGLYPDMPAFDERGANEAGFPWERDYSAIRPAYFDAADLRIFHLVDRGLVPCIVGCWGYHLQWAGDEVIRRHWRNIIARWGALPVAYCIAGEALMPYYLSEDWGSPEYATRTKPRWNAITEYVRSIDPFGRPTTIHPCGDAAGRDMVDEGLLDFDFLQTGHGDRSSFAPTVGHVTRACARTPRMPVINGEVCYEGIIGASWQDVQRLMFWSCVLSGACGHTYGANGIWQVNEPGKPFGPSPHGASWGDTPWTEAYRLPGSTQLGLAKRLLERYRWWLFEPHPEWADPHATPEAPSAPFAAGIRGEVRVYYIPQFAGLSAVAGLEPGSSYRAYYWNPQNGEERDLGVASGDAECRWSPPKPTVFHDWVLVLESESARAETGG